MVKVIQFPKTQDKKQIIRTIRRIRNWAANLRVDKLREISYYMYDENKEIREEARKAFEVFYPERSSSFKFRAISEGRM